MSKKNKVPKISTLYLVRSGHFQLQEGWGSNSSHSGPRGRLCGRCRLEVCGARIKGAIVLSLQTAVGVGDSQLNTTVSIKK